MKTAKVVMWLIIIAMYLSIKVVCDQIVGHVIINSESVTLIGIIFVIILLITTRK